MSLRERLAELEELRAHRLITQEEFESIYAALHMSRGVPPD
jgi:cytochrome c-type biogenesis protein CcmH/NrfG